MIQSKKKSLLVNNANEESAIDVEPDLFEDIFLEACTRLLERNIKSGNYTVGPYINVRLKRSRSKIYTYNTYLVLINASHHYYAENLRTAFKKQTSIDLKCEPMKAMV